MNNHKLPFVSVIIPTYHDWGRLQICVQALEHQTYPNDRFEVIIVNNDPDDAFPNLNTTCQIQLLSEAKPGSYAARNKGIQVAKGEILAFTDSDCIPYPDWIEQAVNVLLHGADRVAGRVEFFYQSDKLTPAEIFEKAFVFNQLKFVDGGASVTANMITWRKFFKAVGLFNDSLMSGGDLEWGWRANAMGIGIAYAPSVVIRHPARSKMRELLGKRKRVVGGVVNIEKNRFSKDFFIKIFNGLSSALKSFFLLMKRKDLSQKEKTVAGLLMVFLQFFKIYHTISLLTGLSKPEKL